MIQFSNHTPDAYAKVTGDKNHPQIEGEVYFFDVYEGTMVMAQISGLQNGNFHGFHIHEGSTCENMGGHYNPNNKEHPFHAGDFPPLLATEKFAWMAFYSDRFHPEDIVGRTVIIHENPDDFHTQPSGNSGPIIACGIIYG